MRVGKLPAAFGVVAGAGLALASPALAANPVVVTPDDPGPEARFGYSVATDGARLLVGSLNNSDIGFHTGCAYVFRRDGAQWVQEAQLFDPAAVFAGRAGTSVALNDEVAVVGAREEAMLPNVGGALVYRRTGQAWAHEVTLHPPDITPSTSVYGYFGFGHAVATDSNRIVVTMPQDDIACPSDPLCNSGSAYVFAYDGSQWLFEQKLIPSDPQRVAHFGRSVAMQGDRIVVGAFQADEVAGAVYVFERQGGVWMEEAKLLNPNPQEGITGQFGESVSLDGDVIAVGAPGDNHAGSYSGAAHIFRRGSTGWTLEQTLTAEDPAPTHFFGQPVAVHGNRLLTGAHWDNRDGTLFRAGAAYLFEYEGGLWSQQDKLVDPNGANEDFFGWSIALHGGTAVVGAQLVNGVGPDSGAVFVFSCRADLNQDGATDVFDLLAYLDLWFGNNPAAELTGDDPTVVDVFDLLAYLDFWFAGC